MNPKTSTLASLLGSASLLAMTGAGAAQAQQVAQAQTAQATPMEIPEQVLVTGSLIHGTAAVGVPVTNLSPQDFAQTGALNTAELFRTVPAANVSPGPVAVQSGANIERATRVNIRGLDTGDAVRTLLLVDGHRFPGQGNGVCEIDPSIIPQLALDRIDILTDGASATYGTAAMAGVINEVLKRNFDGAVTQVRGSIGQGGKRRELASQLWGRTWDGGDITLTYEWYDESPTKGTFNSRFTVDFSPWGLDNRTPLTSSAPAILSIGNATGINSGTTNSSANLTLGTNCTNCWSIPRGTGANFNGALNTGLGPTLPGSAAPFTWAALTVPANGGATNPGAGTRNEFNPYSRAWYDAAQQRNAAVITVDQRLLPNISFFGDGTYSNRRAEYLSPDNLSPSTTNELSVSVPTVNPYYPTGAPTGLKVAYDIGVESPSYVTAYELATMYVFGLNIDLPGNWEARVFMSQEYDSSFSHVAGTVNVNAVSAALGWTMPATNAIGTAPGIAAWTKPATVPYLNLFCDASVFQCNSPTTLNYIGGIRQFDERYWVNEKGGTVDGPLFDLPAGQVKVAVGGLYSTDIFSFKTFDNTGAPNLIAPQLTDALHRADWAGFAQLNVPVIGDQLTLPGVRKLDLEASWRHDQYSGDVNTGISVPKIAFNWNVSEDIGLTIRGSWGTSFRAPGYGETSPLANNNIQAQNSVTNNANIVVNCTPGQSVTSGTEAPQSAFYRLTHPAIGIGWNGIVDNKAGSAACNTAAPAGVSFLGAASVPISAGMRSFAGTPNNPGGAESQLHPEQGLNYSIGAELAPTNFLKGFDAQVTWYSIKITGALRSFGNPTTNSLNDPSNGFAYLVPTDLAAAGVDVAGCSDNNHPENCAEFESMVRNLLNNGRSSVSPTVLTTVLWLNDGGILNAGYIKVQGLDWNWSYDVDLGDFGAFNIGQTGTYYLHQLNANFSSDLITAANVAQDTFHTNLNSVGGIAQSGVESLPRMRYRARIGWSDGPLSATLFADYQSHFFHTQSAPPNVNFACASTGAALGSSGGTLPCAISNYSNIEPGYYTFDLSLGYNTGDDPINDYMKRISFQLVVQNLMNKHAPFEYRISTGGGNPAAFDITKTIQGRMFNFIITKTW